MKDLKTKDIAVVFVGCGGTYWTSQNYFASLLNSIQPSAIYFVDPDRLTLANTERQWCDIPNNRLGFPKVLVATEALADNLQAYKTGTVMDYDAPFADWANNADAQETIEDMQVLVIVNVDNDKARLEIRDWCFDHPRRAVMVMSGCDLNYGQVYYGVYDRNQSVHDWFPLHLDVDPKTAPAPIQTERTGCGAQSTLSNYLTGALFAPAIEEAVRWFNHDFQPKMISEWYWSRNADKGLKMWTQKAAVCMGIEVLDG